MCGPTLANGYLRQPALTAKSFLWLAEVDTTSEAGAEAVSAGAGSSRGGFESISLGAVGEESARAVQDPRRGAASAARARRYFRTGDFGYWQHSQLCFVGRRDQQVKVRGHRVELLEVEAAIGR